MVYLGFIVELSQTSRNLTSSFFFLAYILFLSIPIITHLSSSFNLEFMTNSSDFDPFILMSFSWKNEFVMSMVFCAWSLILTSHIVSSTYAKAVVLIFMECDVLFASLCGSNNRTCYCKKNGYRNSNEH